MKKTDLDVLSFPFVGKPWNICESTSAEIATKYTEYTVDTMYNGSGHGGEGVLLHRNMLIIVNWSLLDMGQIMEVQLSCYPVLPSVNWSLLNVGQVMEVRAAVLLPGFAISW